jgi:hypothetical protein
LWVAAQWRRSYYYFSPSNVLYYTTTKPTGCTDGDCCKWS